MRNRRRLVGFTLIELMVVILILAILAALIVPRVIGRTNDAKRAKAATDIKTLASALQQFRLDCDRFPTTEEGLMALKQAPSDLQGKWHGPYLDSAITPDPWGTEYQYQYPGPEGRESFTLLSFGTDLQSGGTGDDADIGGTNGATGE